MKVATTIRVFKEYISYFATRLVTNRGSCFTSNCFKAFIQDTGIKHVLNAVATPSANGLVERFNRTILDALATKGKTHCKDDDDEDTRYSDWY